MRDGDEYVINGQKIFTSLASDADYCWLAVRTNPDVSKHKGISMFIVPMDTPGITVQPMDLLSEHDINQVFYEDVRVPAANLVGGENNGWSLITNQLNHERVTLCSSGMLEQTLRGGPALGPGDQAGRRPPGHRPGVGAAQPGPGATPGLEFLRLINWKVAWAATEGQPLDVGRRLDHQGVRHRVLPRGLPAAHGGPRAGRRTCAGDRPRRSCSSRLERKYRSLIILTFGGGTNEVQRDLIAMFGLGLPRADR